MFKNSCLRAFQLYSIEAAKINQKKTFSGIRRLKKTKTIFEIAEKWKISREEGNERKFREHFPFPQDKIKHVILFSHGFQSRSNLFICFLICNLLVYPFHMLYPIPTIKLHNENRSREKFLKRK